MKLSKPFLALLLFSFLEVVLVILFCFRIAAGEGGKRFVGGGGGDAVVYTHVASSFTALESAFFKNGGGLRL